MASTFTLPTIEGVDPIRSPFDAFKLAVAASVSKGLPQVPLGKAFEGVTHGSKNADLLVAPARFRLGGKPDQWARKVEEAFEPNEYIESMKVEGAFCHFTIRTVTITRNVLTTIHKLSHPESGEPSYGSNDSGKGKKVVVEYSSPNIAKQFHVGHLRSTIIGAFLANLHKACGWEVISMNYLGDWGKQFGLIAVGFDKYGSKEALDKDPIRHLYEVYVKINKDAEEDPKVHDDARAYFKRMEDGDDSALQHWRNWREHSIEKYKEEYARLNVHFDVYSGESQVTQESQNSALERLEAMGLIEEKDGAKLVDLEKYKLGKAVVRKKDGTSLYITRDIGAAVERYEQFKFDKMVYVVASQQDLHLAQFFKVLQLLDYPWASTLEHVNYGLVQGMSTRKGTAVFLDEIITETTRVMHEQMKQNEEKYASIEDPEYTAQEIGISAIKIQDMSAKRILNYNFNWSRMLSFEGDTGPYIQYAHVRLASVERKNPNFIPLPDPSLIKLELLTEPKAREIVLHLAKYPEVVKVAMETYQPSGVVTFAMTLAHMIASAWQTLLVKGEEDEEKARARLFMYTCARDVLGASLRLLSITPLERM